MTQWRAQKVGVSIVRELYGRLYETCNSGIHVHSAAGSVLSTFSPLSAIVEDGTLWPVISTGSVGNRPGMPGSRSIDSQHRTPNGEPYEPVINAVTHCNRFRPP